VRNKTVVILLLIIILVIGRYYFLGGPKVSELVTYDLTNILNGEIVDANDFLLGDNSFLFQRDVEILNANMQEISKALGKHSVMLKIGNRKYSTTMEVVDYFPPDVTFKKHVQKTIQGGSKATTADFIIDATDATKFTSKFLSAPEARLGKQDLVIEVEDETGNKVILNVVLEYVLEMPDPNKTCDCEVCKQLPEAKK